ncbi:hypothetical protein Cgig2_001960 [Carnegiea gigantea]|uniref:DUF4283 domain-containing protein n=1 Tax=Carnegiea gigantea TaxID=171969 RepID=A0A9Q1Q791_9CARY|nr:hypothetical protein Cgig2_001960 [Carnegiea gigantea]
MKGFLKRIWANYEIDRILCFPGSLCSTPGQNCCEKRGFYFFDSKPMLVKGWNPTMDLQTEIIRSLPIWIQLHALEIKYWGIESLSKTGSILGIPLKTDKFTKDKPVIRYARLLVEMQIEGPFPEHIEFFNEDGVLLRQQVTYEWIPSKYTHCAMLGHTEDVCKKKGVIRTEWRRIQPLRAPSQPDNNQPRGEQHINTQTLQTFGALTTLEQPKPNEGPTHEVCSDTFTHVSKGASPKRTLATPTSPTATHSNRFNPSLYSVTIQEKFDQFIHCKVTHLSTNKRFHITQPLWAALQHLSSSIQGAWCLLGDFNAILSKKDYFGGNIVTDHDIQEMSNFMMNCEVQEMPSSGAFFTWTNKTIWSKIDGVFINNLWHEEFDYTLAKFLPHGLSDHTPILIQLHKPPKPPPQFQFCGMWSTHKDFQGIVSTSLPDIKSPDIMRPAQDYFSHLRRQL